MNSNKTTHITPSRSLSFLPFCWKKNINYRINRLCLLCICKCFFVSYILEEITTSRAYRPATARGPRYRCSRCSRCAQRSCWVYDTNWMCVSYSCTYLWENAHMYADPSRTNRLTSAYVLSECVYLYTYGFNNFNKFFFTFVMNKNTYLILLPTSTRYSITKKRPKICFTQTNCLWWFYNKIHWLH